MWVPIHDAHRDNGTLQVVARTREQACNTLDHTRDGTSDHHITCQASINDADALLCEVPAGGVVFFNYGVPHTTGENVTSKPRAAIAYHFLNRAHYRDRALPLPEDCEYVTPAVTGKSCTDG